MGAVKERNDDWIDTQTIFITMQANQWLYFVTSDLYEHPKKEPTHN
jgi:hypothetical protein